MNHPLLGLTDLFLTLSPEHFRQALHELSPLPHDEWGLVLDAFEQAKRDERPVRYASRLYRICQPYWSDIGRYADAGYYWRVLPRPLDDDTAERYRRRHADALEPFLQLMVEVMKEEGWTL